MGKGPRGNSATVGKELKPNANSIFMRKLRKGVLAPKPFAGYVMNRVFHKGEGRWYACLYPIKSGLKRRTTSLARYMMSAHLGRILGPGEHVGHINGDKTDDRIQNLQVLTPAGNTKKSSPGPDMVHGTLSCYRYCKCELCRKAKSDWMRNYYLTHRRIRKPRVCVPRITAPSNYGVYVPSFNGPVFDD